MTENSNVPPPGSRAYQRGAHDDRVTPKDLRVLVREQRLEIDWSDGTNSEYSLAQLRKRCPCAECRSERDKQSDNPLKILKSDPSGLRVVSAELVGAAPPVVAGVDGGGGGGGEVRRPRICVSSPTCSCQSMIWSAPCSRFLLTRKSTR